MMYTVGANTNQIAKFLGVPYQTIHFWLRSGVLGKNLAAPGTGIRRIFYHTDIMALLIVQELVKAGATLKSAGFVVRHFLTLAKSGVDTSDMICFAGSESIKIVRQHKDVAEKTFARIIKDLTLRGTSEVGVIRTVLFFGVYSKKALEFLKELERRGEGVV